MSPSPLVFESVPVGVTETGELQLSNVGTWPLEVKSLEIEGLGFGLALEGALPFVVAAGGARTLTLSYRGSATGGAEGSLRIGSDDPAHPTVVVPLVARRGTGPVLIICSGSEEARLAERCGSAPPLDLGATAIGQVRRGTITLHSAGSEPLKLSAWSLPTAAPWSVTATTSTPPITLPPGAHLEWTAQFAPAEIGDSVAQVQLTSNDPHGTERVIEVRAQGVKPSLCVTPALVDFGALAVGQSAERTFNVANCGEGSVSVTALELLSGAEVFQLVDPPAVPIVLGSPGVNVTLTARYTPTRVAQDVGRLRLASPSTDAVIDLRGGAGDCQLEVTPSRLELRPGVGAGVVQVANVGPARCEIVDLRIGADSGPGFLLAVPPLPEGGTSFPYSLAPGVEFVANVQYEPEVVPPTPAVGQLLLELPNRTITVDLTGIAEAQGACTFSRVVPRILDFGPVDLGHRRVMGVELTPRRIPCELGSVALAPGSDPAFTLVNNAPEVIAGPIFVDVAYRSEERRFAVGSLVVAPPGQPSLEIPLRARTGASGLCVDPQNLDFGVVSGPAVRSIQLTACADRPVQLSGLSFSQGDPEFSLPGAPTLPLLLAAGGSLTLQVRYAPTDTIGDTAILAIDSDDPGRPRAAVRLTGGRAIVPEAAGRFIYYWGGFTEIKRIGLQGSPVPETVDGGTAGACAGCHSLSPDGRFVGVHRFGAQDRRIFIHDTVTGTIAVGPGSSTETNGDVGTIGLSWNPNINTDPPYQYVYARGGDLYLASLYAGELGPLAGASDPAWIEGLPSWGPDGQIVFTRSDLPAAPGDTAFSGASSLYLVSSGGGTPEPVVGASANGAANYHPQFSPNGVWIAFNHSVAARTTISASDSQIHLVKADQSGTVVLLPKVNDPPDGVPASWATWSLDGNYLSFSSKRLGGEGDWDLYLAPVDPNTGLDGDPINLSELNTSGFEHGALWSP